KTRTGRRSNSDILKKLSARDFLAHDPSGIPESILYPPPALPHRSMQRPQSQRAAMTIQARSYIAVAGIEDSSPSKVQTIGRVNIPSSSKTGSFPRPTSQPKQSAVTSGISM